MDLSLALSSLTRLADISPSGAAPFDADRGNGGHDAALDNLCAADGHGCGDNTDGSYSRYQHAIPSSDVSTFYADTMARFLPSHRHIPNNI